MPTSFGDTKQIAIGPVRGIREFSIPGDASGSQQGASGIHFGVTFTGFYDITDQDVSASSRPFSYFSLIHDNVGSASGGANVPGGSPAGPLPAFVGPSVTTKSGAFAATENMFRTASEGPTATTGKNWMTTFSCSKLVASLGLWSTTATDFFKLVVIRDVNASDKTAALIGTSNIAFGSTTLNFNGVVAYESEPFKSLPAGTNHFNFVQSVPLQLAFATSFIIGLVNISSAANTNTVVGSVFMLP